MPDHPLPSEQEVLSYFDRCNNWGRWGADDTAGTVNLITPAKRLEAAATVRSGRAVSIAHRFNTIPQPGNAFPVQHFVQWTPAASWDYFSIRFHGYATTHVDALCHIFWEGKGYNGKAVEDFMTSLGARHGAVDAWAEGITTRGVLIDIPRLRGTTHITLETPVRGWEIEAAAEAEGVDLREGDAVLVYSGRTGFYQANPAAAPGVRPTPGLHADCIPVLHDRGAAILGWDLLDASPSGYETFDGPAVPGGPLHVLAIVYMGMPLLDNANLDPLAAACAEEGRWEFMLTLNPLNIRGGTGSPVNPVALF